MIIAEPASLLEFRRRCASCNVGIIIRISMACTLFILIFILIFYNRYEIIHVVTISTETEADFEVSKRFLSFALDASVLQRKLHNFNTTDPRLITMLKELSPAFFRIGGKLQDRLYFSPDNIDNNFTQPNISLPTDGGECAYENICPSFSKGFNNFTFSGANWLKLADLAEKANVDLIFGLNSLIRFDNKSWDYRNAESMMKFSKDHNLKVNWELGNEPNSFKHVFNYSVDPEQMAYDFHTLRSVVDKYETRQNYVILGPDVTRPKEENKESMEYLKTFLQYIDNALDIVTWHQYYFNGRTAKPDDFLNPNIFDLLHHQASIVKKIVNGHRLEHSHEVNWKAIWLGETSSAYGGGAPGLSDRFISTFIWLDKLGLAATSEIRGVMRQSIFDGHYALIDENYNPNPDWWVSVLYKKLVGGRVIKTTLTGLPLVRLYCHCAKLDKVNSSKDAIVFGMNLNNANAAVRILFKSLKQPVYILEYMLTSDSLFDKNVFLNGKLLKMTPSHEVPELKPRVIPAKEYLTLPPHSLVFWRFPHIRVQACESEKYHSDLYNWNSYL